MPIQERHKTKYPGVYFINGTSARGKCERIYYIYYRKDERIITEKAGRQFQDDMTAARAAHIRSLRIEGKQLSNKERRQELEAEKLAQTNRWTILKLWNEYKAVVPLKGIVTDKNRFKNYIEPVFSDKEPCEIAPLDIDRLRVRLLKKLRPQTVKNILELLRRIINFGANRGVCEGLKFKIKMPSVDNTKTESLTDEQLQTLLKAIDEDSNIQVAHLMKLALCTGMRRSELLRLQWKDIDFERNLIYLQNTKSGKSQTIPLNAVSKDLLENHPRIEGTDFVFPGKNGKQRNCVQKESNRIKERAGLPKDFRALHGLRHSYASLLASSGEVDLYILQKLMTHSSPQMTQRYAHLRDETLRKASNVASNIVNGALKDNKDNIIEIEK